MVFYFTGTGNSLYVAKQLEAAPISIPQAIHDNNKRYTGESIGIVSPVYGHEMPHMVKDFIRNSLFDTDYFYLILTYGNRHGGASELAKKFLEDCDLDVDYINVIMMVDNWLPSFDMDEQIKLDKHIPEHIYEIKNDITSRKRIISEVTETDREAHRGFLERLKSRSSNGGERQSFFTVSDKCTGCGICKSVCPSASIEIKNGQAVHLQKGCQTCLACTHACPVKAIGLRIPEKNPNARYRNEHISLSEIIAANDQHSAASER